VEYFSVQSDVWIIEDAERRRLEVIKVWCYRRMMRISWVDKVTKEEVCGRIWLKEEMH
jgi:hypothetical protein